MKEKTTHFARFKEEVERLEKEKKDSITTWSAKLDWHQVTVERYDGEKNYALRDEIDA